MAIPGMSSQDYNQILKNAQERITTLDRKIDLVKADVAKKLSIIRYETEYVNTQLAAMASQAITKDTKLKLLARDGSGQFETYGATVHPVFMKTPINIFNLRISGSGEHFFREDVQVAVNGVYAEEHKNILKHDTHKTKEAFFQVFTSPDLKLEIVVDTANRLGDSRFNMMELDSFLPGSYDVTAIEVYGVDENGVLKSTPTTFPAVKKAGKQRIIFPEKMKFHKVALQIKLRGMAEGDKTVYPFGLKHLYFYDADFRSDSYAVVRIQAESPIAIVKDVIRVISPFATAEDVTAASTVGAEEIRLYIDQIGGGLETEIYASEPSQRNEIARTVTTIYARIPLKNRALTGVAFHIETRA